MLSSRCFPFSSIPFLLSPSEIGKRAISFSFLNPTPHLAPPPPPHPPPSHPPDTHTHALLGAGAPRGLTGVTPQPSNHSCPEMNLAGAVSAPVTRRIEGGGGAKYRRGGTNCGTAGLAYMHPFWAACLFIACLSFERMELGCQVLTPPHMASSINRTNQASRGGRTGLIASQI